MAATCPKCNYKLKLTDWRPECPNCGVNVVYYGIEERLREEADVAERHYAVSKPKYDRLKFSLIGHPLSIVRIVLGILPVVMLMLPMGRVDYTLPFGSGSETVNLISVIMFIVNHGFDVDALSALFGSQLLGKSFVCLAVWLVSMVLIVLLGFVAFILLTLSCAPRGLRRNVGFSVAGIAIATVGFIAFIVMIGSLNAALPGVFSGSVNPAAYIGLLCLYAAMIAVNVIYKKKNIQVKYTDVSELLLPYNERPSTIAKKQQQAAAQAGAAAE